MASVHCGHVWATRPAAEESAFAPPDVDRTSGPGGHRHFLRQPGEAERSRLLRTEAEREAHVAMLHRLSRVMQPAGDRLRENPLIPSGYTYLLQLVARDCGHRPMPFRQIPATRAEARSRRSARLRLEMVYGNGRPGIPGEAAKGQAAFADPIGDARDADNPLVGQMNALWRMVHNALVDVAGLPAGAPVQGQACEPVFAWARAATTVIYRRILRRDVLRRLLDPAIYERYRKAGPADLLDRDPDPARPVLSVPLEFSQGAMRFAHAMIRPSYDLTENFPRGPQSMPLTRGGIVPWGRFFEVPAEDGAAPTLPKNLSLRIRPSYASPRHGGAGPAAGAPGLALQDMMGAGAAQLWSVSALHAAIATRARELERPWIAPFGDLDLARAVPRAEAIAAWLQENADPRDPFPRAEAEMLTRDPPLPFYVQFEAWRRHGGYRLGPLGSILVAEALFGIMLADPLPGETGDGPLVQGLAALAATLGLMIARPADLPDIEDMGGLVRFVARIQGLGAAGLPVV